MSPQKDPLYPWKSLSPFQCHFVPVSNLTRGWWQKKKDQSVTLVAPENMKILDFCVWENGKHCLVKKSGIWIGSFNCVQSESGQMLLWSCEAWRKFICKLHPIFGETVSFQIQAQIQNWHRAKSISYILCNSKGNLKVQVYFRFWQLCKGENLNSFKCYTVWCFFFSFTTISQPVYHSILTKY